MKRIWVLAANKSAGTLYRVSYGYKELTPVRGFLCKEARLPTKNFRDDKPGVLNKSFSEQRGMSGGLHKENADLLHQFSSEIAGYINKAKAKNDFDDLFIVSDSRVLGDIRARLSKGARNSLIKSYAKNPKGMTDGQILQYLEFSPEELLA